MTIAISPDQLAKQFPAICKDPAGAQALLGVLQSKTVATGEILIARGQPSDTLYLVVSGRLQVTLHAGKTQLKIGEIEPGHSAGEFGFIDPGLAAADVIAAETTTVLALPQTGLHELLRTSPNTASSLLQGLSLELSRRLRNTSEYVVEKIDEGIYAFRQRPQDDNENLLIRIGRTIMGLSGERQ